MILKAPIQNQYHDEQVLSGLECRTYEPTEHLVMEDAYLYRALYDHKGILRAEIIMHLSNYAGITTEILKKSFGSACVPLLLRIPTYTLDGGDLVVFIKSYVGEVVTLHAPIRVGGHM